MYLKWVIVKKNFLLYLLTSWKPLEKREGSGAESGSVISGTNPQIRIRSKTLWIRNTGVISLAVFQNIAWWTTVSCNFIFKRTVNWLIDTDLTLNSERKGLKKKNSRQVQCLKGTDSIWGRMAPRTHITFILSYNNHSKDGALVPKKTCQLTLGLIINTLF
jgi:hypothetical protein